MSVKRRYKAFINNESIYCYAKVVSHHTAAVNLLKRRARNKFGNNWKCTDFLIEDSVNQNKYNRISFGF